MLQLSMVPYKAVRAAAMPTVQSAIKRFPALASLLLPHALAAIAGQPLPYSHLVPEPGSDNSASELTQHLSEFYGVTLRDAMMHRPADSAAVTAAAGPAASAASAAAAAAGGVLPPGVPAGLAAAVAAAAAAAGGGKGGGGSSAAQESENDGRVAGGMALMSSSIECWRALFRDPLLFAGMLRAIMASRVHTSSACQNVVADLLLQVIGGGEAGGDRGGIWRGGWSTGNEGVFEQAGRSCCMGCGGCEIGEGRRGGAGGGRVEMEEWGWLEGGV